MPVEYFFPIVYLLIGVFFGELSLKVKRATPEENAPLIKGMVYFFAIFTWPVIVIFAVMKSGGRS